MTHHEVKSSNILSIGYDPTTKTMEVKFKTGGHYLYHDVSDTDYSALMAAESHRKHFVKSFHPKGHKFTRLDKKGE